MHNVYQKKYCVKQRPDHNNGYEVGCFVLADPADV